MAHSANDTYGSGLQRQFAWIGTREQSSLIAHSTQQSGCFWTRQPVPNNTLGSRNFFSASTSSDENTDENWQAGSSQWGTYAAFG